MTVAIEQIEVIQVLVVIACIGVRYLLVLAADDQHHNYQKHINKHLHSYQAEFPTAGILCMVLDRSENRDSLIQFCRDHDGNNEYEQQNRRDGYNTLRYQ